MARIRTVKPDFFRHEKLFESEQLCGLPLRLAFAGLWTTADREGRFRWHPRALKLDCLPYDDIDFAGVLDALCSAGFIIRYRVGDDEYGYIPGWHKHQHINQREAPSTIPAPSGDEPCAARAVTCTTIPAHGEGKGMEGEREWKGNSSGAVASATRTAGDQEFEEFWKAYPSRGTARNPKHPARKRFDAAVSAGVDPKAIIAAAGHHRESMQKLGKIGTEYVPMAVTWLEQRGYEDEQRPAVSSPPPLPVHGAILGPEAGKYAGWIYLKAGSPESDAHCSAMRAQGRVPPPQDKNGGWMFETRWPPGYIQPGAPEPIPDFLDRRATAQTQQ